MACTRAAHLDGLLAPGRAVQAVEAGIWSALSDPCAEQHYDSRGAAYDRLVRLRPYSRLAWGCPLAAFERSARDALAHAEGPYLDVGCGALSQTAAAYAGARRPLVLLDQSVAMLRIGRDRVAALAGGLPERTVWLQGDAFDLPFRPGAFPTVVCIGILHLFADPRPLLRSLLDATAPDGAVFLMSLVTGRRFGDAYLRLLHRSGEIAPPSGPDALRAALDATGRTYELTVRGNAAFARL